MILWPISDVRYAENSVETVETLLVVILVISTIIPLVSYSIINRNRVVVLFLKKTKNENMPKYLVLLQIF